jgi:prepilin-type N-terminal cleavage/methylation domain-containing protein
MFRRPRAGETEAERGFTLIELMIVVLIIAMLIAIGLPTWTAARERADDAEALSLVTDAQHALQVVVADNVAIGAVTIPDLDDAEPAVRYVNAATDPEARDDEVSVYVDGPGNYTILSTRVHGGGCVAVRTRTDVGPQYRRDPAVTACRAGALDLPAGWFSKWPPRA